MLPAPHKPPPFVLQTLLHLSKNLRLPQVSFILNYVKRPKLIIANVWLPQVHSEPTNLLYAPTFFTPLALSTPLVDHFSV